MFTNVWTDFIVGSITILGGIILLLHRFDLVQLGKKETTVDPLMELKECSAHKDVVIKLTAVYDQQIKNNTLHTQHAAQLKDGQDEFKKVAEAIALIGQSIAVLLDRSNRAERIKKNELPMG